MKVLNRSRNNEAECEKCGSILQYEKADIKTGAFGLAYIVCPVCGAKICLEDGLNDKEVTHDNIEYPKDFWQVDETAKRVPDEVVAEYVKDIAKELKNGVDYTAIMYGDTCVIGFHTTEEDTIIVARDYDEGLIFLGGDEK